MSNVRSSLSDHAAFNRAIVVDDRPSAHPDVPARPRALRRRCPSRKALGVQPGQQLLDRLCPPQIGRQYRRRETDAASRHPRSDGGEPLRGLPRSRRSRMFGPLIPADDRGEPATHGGGGSHPPDRRASANERRHLIASTSTGLRAQQTPRAGWRAGHISVHGRLWEDPRSLKFCFLDRRKLETTVSSMAYPCLRGNDELFITYFASRYAAFNSLHRPRDSSIAGLVQTAVCPGTTIRTDGWRAYNGLAGAGFEHQPKNSSASGDPAHIVMPRVHRVAGLLDRWWLGIHHEAISASQLDCYLDEFTFRFNRRRSQARGLLFYRLLQQAVQLEPIISDG